MKNLILIVTLLAHTAHASAQDYVPYGYPENAPPAVNYYNSAPRVSAPSYVQTIENNGPQVDQRRNAEGRSRQLENMNTIRNYQLIYGDTYRR